MKQFTVVTFSSTYYSPPITADGACAFAVLRSDKQRGGCSAAESCDANEIKV
jgi:hypothetical protein